MIQLRHLFKNGVIAAVALSTAIGCATTGKEVTHRTENAEVTITTSRTNAPDGSSGKYMDPKAPSDLQVVGIESYDIAGACSSIVGKMLANPLLGAQAEAPHIIVDATLLKNQTSERLSTNLLADKLRAELSKAANGRLRFVGREYIQRVQQERTMKETGAVGEGTTPKSNTQLGADYQLAGRLTDQEQRDTGRVERYTQFSFDVVDLETGEIILSDTYDIKKGVSVHRAYQLKDGN